MGSRYGVKIRKREREVLKKSRGTYESPIIHKMSVRRLGTAKWICDSTGYVFAGGAYEPETTVGATARKTIETLRSAKNGKQTEEQTQSN
ncbi:50S ribosomal protein L37Ae [uncultured archaeon]|nr:50S ribosomal protein L37Ae [uncultured archaeon]